MESRRKESHYFYSKIEVVKNKIIVLFILVCLLGAYQYNLQMKKQYKLQEMIEELKEYYHSEKEINDFVLSTLKEDIKLCFQNEGLILNSQTPLIEDGKGTHMMVDIIKNKTLVIRFSQLNCQACIEAIKPLLKGLKTKQVVVFADYTNKRFLKEFKKGLNESWRLFNVKLLNIPMDDLNIPYFFVLDEEMRLSHVFIPHKEMLSHVEEYLEIIEQHL